MSHNRQNDTDKSGKNHDQRRPEQQAAKPRDQREGLKAQENRTNRPGDVGNQNPQDDDNDRPSADLGEIESFLDTSRPIDDDEDQMIREGAENDDAIADAEDKRGKSKKGPQPSYPQR